MAWRLRSSNKAIPSAEQRLPSLVRTTDDADFTDLILPDSRPWLKPQMTQITQI